jgi:hypothetical protein
MAGQVGQLQQTLSMNLLQSQMATQAAHVTVMMEDFTQAQASLPSHPSLGTKIDVKI